MMTENQNQLVKIKEHPPYRPQPQQERILVLLSVVSLIDALPWTFLYNISQFLQCPRPLRLWDLIPWATTPTTPRLPPAPSPTLPWRAPVLPPRLSPIASHPASCHLMIHGHASWGSNSCSPPAVPYTVTTLHSHCYNPIAVPPNRPSTCSSQAKVKQEQWWLRWWGWRGIQTWIHCWSAPHDS